MSGRFSAELASGPMLCMNKRTGEGNVDGERRKEGVGKVGYTTNSNLKAKVLCRIDLTSGEAHMHIVCMLACMHVCLNV